MGRCATNLLIVCFALAILVLAGCQQLISAEESIEHAAYRLRHTQPPQPLTQRPPGTNCPP